MKIIDIVSKVKAYSKGEWMGRVIKDETTRDKILFGDPNQECTGIVTTVWATIDVIKKAQELGCNFIICHEALFWNRGDHQDWLNEQQNQTYLLKKELLEKNNMVVWRFHDHIHSGIPMEHGYTDGIFYGVFKQLGWLEYTDPNYYTNPRQFNIPETTLEEVAKLVMEKFNLTGVKTIGNKDSKIKKVWVCGHIMEGDNDKITYIEQNDIDLVISLETIDYTVSEYIKDSSQLGRNKALLTVGHFNGEEYGMKYVDEYLEKAIGEKIECTFVQAGDMYTYFHN